MSLLPIPSYQYQEYRCSKHIMLEFNTLCLQTWSSNQESPSPKCFTLNFSHWEEIGVGLGTMSCSRSKAVLPLVNDRSLRSDSQASPRQFSGYLVDLANLIPKERDRTQTWEEVLVVLESYLWPYIIMPNLSPKTLLHYDSSFYFLVLRWTPQLLTEVTHRDVTTDPLLPRMGWKGGQEPAVPKLWLPLWMKLIIHGIFCYVLAVLIW